MSKIKVIVVGAPGSGKTSILRRFVLNKFSDAYLMSVGETIWEVEKKFNGEKVYFQLWDISGERRWQVYDGPFYRDASGVLMVFDLRRLNTLWDLEKWCRLIDSKCNIPPIRVLVGNKLDLINGAEVIPQDTIDAAVMRLRANAFLKISAKSGENVEQAFYLLIRELKTRSRYISPVTVNTSS
ncbi:MAG: Rab family GTPase [Candidatus Korarchaeota archaeon]